MEARSRPRLVVVLLSQHNNHIYIYLNVQIPLLDITLLDLDVSTQGAVQKHLAALLCCSFYVLESTPVNLQFTFD